MSGLIVGSATSKSATKPAVRKPASIAEKVSAPANTNVILTNFEKSVLEKFKPTDEHGVVIRECDINDIYSKHIHESVNEETGEVTKTSFLSLKGRFLNSAGVALNVTIVVVNDKRFYMSLGNKEIKDRTGQDLFVNHWPHMLTVFGAMSQSNLSPEQIEEEANNINSFGA